jgi:hypothetical protein
VAIIRRPINLRGDRRRVRGAVAVTVKGEKFQSKREAKRWLELKLLERAGDIENLRRQVYFPLRTVNTHGEIVIVGHYVADFTYRPRNLTEPLAYQMRVEDVKGWRTDLYDWKRRHVKAEYEIDIVEV